LLYSVIGLLSLLIAANLYLGINKAVTHHPVPKVFGFAPFVVLSGSMEPAIDPGDLVVIREQKADAYKIGDIVSYLDGRVVYTHRIVGVEEGKYVLKGDNNNVADGTIRPEQLVGRVQFIIPKLGLLVILLKKPAGMAFVAVMLLICFLAADYLKNRRRRAAEARKRGDNM